MGHHSMNDLTKTAERICALTITQQRLWLLNELLPDNPSYNIAAGLRLQGVLAPHVLELAINEILRRHEILRASFAKHEGAPIQVILPSLQLAMRCIGVTGTSEQERERNALQLAMKECQASFDLSQPPLLRCTLLRLTDHEHWLVLTMHRLIADEWSASLFFHELTALYMAFSSGGPSPLSEPSLQYEAFMERQHDCLSGELFERSLSYWKRQLQGISWEQLPVDRPRRPFVLSAEAVSVHWSIRTLEER